jgi:hypothetical protein
MGYISGMAMGNIIQNYLTENNLYSQENYKSAYKSCKDRCHKITTGAGKATRHRYYDSEIIPILIDWKEHLN